MIDPCGGIAFQNFLYLWLVLVLMQQLLDLVVKHKLELLQFLGFLLQVVDPLIFVSNSMLAFRQFKLLRLDRRLQLVEQSD